MSQSLSLLQLFELFPDERSVEKWLEYQLWGNLSNVLDVLVPNPFQLEKIGNRCPIGVVLVKSILISERIP